MKLKDKLLELKHDTTTINRRALAMLPVHKMPPSYQLQRSPGNGCAGDPPGHPTYFTQAVYTMHGNTPARGAQMVIFGRVVQSSTDWDSVKSWDEYHAKYQARMKKLWLPLPLDHPRTVEWIKRTYSHFNHCYQHPTEQEHGKPKTVILPVPYYELQSFTDDPRFSDEWREKEKAAIEQRNQEVTKEREGVCTPDNHMAVVIIRRYYPDHEPNLDYITDAPEHGGTWWERYATRPAPEDCPGDIGMKHPINGSWCQMCGYKAAE